MTDPMHFDALAEVYDRARPPYPEALWSRLNDLGLLQAGVRVIELGAGTGHATESLVDSGCIVTAIEPGRALAAMLRARLPGVTVVVSTAENAPLRDGMFDLAVAATSVHWFDLDVVLPKLHRALVPGGHFAVWRTAFGDPGVSSPFRDRIAAIVARRAGADPRTAPAELETEEWVSRLTSGGYFTRTHTDHFRWRIDLDADRVHDLFSTFSDWTPAEAAEAAAAARDLGGSVTEHYVTPLIVLQRASRTEPERPRTANAR